MMQAIIPTIKCILNPAYIISIIERPYAIVKRIFRRFQKIRYKASKASVVYKKTMCLSVVSSDEGIITITKCKRKCK